MNMQIARQALNSIPSNCEDVHPMAVEGNLHDFIRANDKAAGLTVQHYANKGGLFYVLSKQPVRPGGKQKRRVLGR
jgi:hypothetical protein